MPAVRCLGSGLCRAACGGQQRARVAGGVLGMALLDGAAHQVHQQGGLGAETFLSCQRRTQRVQPMPLSRTAGRCQLRTLPRKPQVPYAAGLDIVNQDGRKNSVRNFYPLCLRLCQAFTFPRRLAS